MKKNYWIIDSSPRPQSHIVTASTPEEAAAAFLLRTNGAHPPIYVHSIARNHWPRRPPALTLETEAELLATLRTTHPRAEDGR